MENIIKESQIKEMKGEIKVIEEFLGIKSLEDVIKELIVKTLNLRLIGELE